MARAPRGVPAGLQDRMWVRTPPVLVKSSSCIFMAPLLLLRPFHRLALQNGQ